MNLKRRLKRLELRPVRPMPAAASGPALPSPEELSRLSAADLYALYLGTTEQGAAGHDGVVSWETMQAMNAFELVRVYFAEGAA